MALIPFSVFSQSGKNPCETLSRINAIIQEQHYRPKPVDDSLSVYVFRTFLNQLDENNNLFTKGEVDLLKKHEFEIDNHIADRDCKFLYDFLSVYNLAVDRYSRIISEIASEPFDFCSEESVQFSKKAFPHMESEAQLKKMYKKAILFGILKDVAEVSTNKDSVLTHFETLSKASKAKIFDTYSCKTSGFRFSETDFYAKFYTVFCSYFDPHTDYLSETEKSSFLSMVSSDNLSFGIYFTMDEKDAVAVAAILPGSSAYFTEKIGVGDELIKIGAGGTEFVISCSSVDKIEQIITSNDYLSADFTFRKKTGETYTVALQKKILRDYENNVYSYIIQKENTKTGYIKIPSFYDTFENGKRGVSRDVAREINKLNADKVDGLIIDLENNGGGSMEEAIKMTDFFLDAGPVAIMDNRLGNLEVIKNMSRKKFYSGPMVVMINGFSASASEFFTNTIQDYNRAIVIGNQSQGKASMQRILPLDEENDAFLKITLEKFYRITGKTNQTFGITPDVIMPTLFDKQMPRESSYLNTLDDFSTVEPVKFRSANDPFRTDEIERSKKRVAENPSFAEINSLNAKIDALYDNDMPSVALDFESVFKEVGRLNALWKEIQKTSEKEFALDVTNNSYDVDNQQYDEYLKSSNTEKIKLVKSNPHIVEAVNILHDLYKNKK